MSEQVSLEAMVDLETYGKDSRAAIISIGACHFNPYAYGHHGAPFEVFVNPQSCVDIGMVVDVDTVNWWMGAYCKDDEERAAMDVARRLLADKLKSAVPIRDALHRFSAWVGQNKPVWGNGATFDNVILRNAYELAGIPCPWEFWNDRCYRTMKSRAPSVRLQRKGPIHSAMWDAISQAEHLQEINRFIDSGE